MKYSVSEGCIINLATLTFFFSISDWQVNCQDGNILSSSRCVKQSGSTSCLSEETLLKNTETGLDAGEKAMCADPVVCMVAGIGEIIILNL